MRQADVYLSLSLSLYIYANTGVCIVRIYDMFAVYVHYTCWTRAGAYKPLRICGLHRRRAAYLRIIALVGARSCGAAWGRRDLWRPVGVASGSEQPSCRGLVHLVCVRV